MKTIFMNLAMTMLLIISIACQRNDERSKLAYEAVVENQNEDLVRRYIELINEGDFEKLNEVLSEKYAIYSPSGYATPTSREGLINNYKAAGDSFSKFAWNIKDIISTKDKVVCRIQVTGVYNNLAVDPPEENEFSFSLISIIRIENQKIVEEWQEDDQLGFARQLGMVLKPMDK